MQTRSKRQRDSSSKSATRLDTAPFALRKRKRLAVARHEQSEPKHSVQQPVAARAACTPASCAIKRAAAAAATGARASRPSPDASAMAALRADGRFDAVIARFGSAGPFTRRDVFDSCVRAVVFQQLHGGAARAIMARVRDAAGRGGVGDDGPLLPCDLVATSEAALRAAGLSRQKAGYVAAAAARWHAGEFSETALERMDDEGVVAELTRLKGYGEWSAQVVMLRALQRVDVMPLGDYALMKGAGMLLGGKPSRERVRAAFESLRPYRAYAAFYLWKLADGLDGSIE